MICKKCGKILEDSTQFCDNCGTSTTSSAKTKNETIKCLPSFILGLIGSILGMFGGLCTTMCDVLGGGNAPFLFIFGGSVIGLIGACMCLSKARLGSVLELIGSLMIIYCAFFKTGSGIMTVFGLVLLLAGGLIGVVYSFIIKRK